jgi:hypothetical protein
MARRASPWDRIRLKSNASFEVKIKEGAESVTMDSREYPTRYLHIAGAFAAGGTVNQIDNNAVYVQIQAIAPAHLPMAGGKSEAKAGRTTVDCRKVKFPDVPPAVLRKLRETELISVGSSYSLAQTEPEVAGKPILSRTVSEVKSVRMAGGLSMRYGVLNLQSSHAPGERHPRITFGKTEISGLKLGKSELRITLDLDTFNRLSTLEAFEAAFQKDAQLQAELSPRFLMDGAALHRNQSGYVVGSIVKSIEGLPKDARLVDGYTILWPPVGRIVLGEILMGPYVRRVTLVRVKESCVEVGSDCSGGSTLP